MVYFTLTKQQSSMKNNLNHKWVFFGTPELSVIILDELHADGYVPSLIVTQPDKPKGRGKVLTPPPVKVWALAHSIPFVQPARIDEDLLQTLRETASDCFVLAAYGKMLPQALIDIPPKGIVNVHPSLLPRLRGPSPIQSAILTDEHPTGVSIMLIDAEMDHGPLIAQREVPTDEWPPYAPDLEQMLAHAGGTLLAEVFSPYLDGTITPQPQDHSTATFCKLIKKEDACIYVDEDPQATIRKIRGYAGWPIAYTYFERDGQTLRVQILTAHSEGGKLVIDTVRPEGKNTMVYKDFLRSGAIPIRRPVD